MAISYQSVAQECATFYAASGTSSGIPCKISAADTVSACALGDNFCGVIQNVKDGIACVAIRGFVTLPYSGTAPTVGYAALSATADGKVQVDESAHEYLIVHIDTTAKTVTFLL